MTEKRWRHHFFHRSRARNSKMTGQIRPKFELVRHFMPILVTCKFDEVWIHSNWEKLETQFSASKVNGNAQGRITPWWKVWPGPNSNASEIFCLSFLSASLTKIRLNVTEKMRGHRFAHYMSMEAFCCHGNHSFDPICPQNLMEPFPYPKDASDKIWLKLVNWSWRCNCSKVWTTDDDGWRTTEHR